MYNYHQELIKNSRNNSVEPSKKKQVQQQKKFNIKHVSGKGNTLLKTGIIVSIGLALHNFPEGLAIGSGFEASLNLGYSLALAIALHDIPEGRFQSRHW